MRNAKNIFYETITGRRLDCSRLNSREKSFLSLVGREYKARPDWNRFAAWWNAQFQKADLRTSSIAYRICQDLEARIGIDQGKVSPPDYRDFLADFIVERYGSRYRLCKQTNIDPGQLSRVFAGRADLSLKALQKILSALHAALVIQPEAEVREHAYFVLANEFQASAFYLLRTLSVGQRQLHFLVNDNYTSLSATINFPYF
ncbi:MAG: hypothetical protein NTV79_01190 [Candidatus Aureabacteria bacterium]|nr:hypothetical protein [Candidatus Auribacterota bacterium]